MDGASNRGIDAIRELTEAVRYQPAVLRKKVYVIDEVHMLTTEAFNALLKTLEEPPPHVTFVLATTEPHKLPNTILSRCQRYDFKLVPAARLAQHLARIFGEEKLAIESSAVSFARARVGRSVRDALSLSDQLISYVGESTITEQHVAEVLGVADRALTRMLVGALRVGRSRPRVVGGRVRRSSAESMKFQIARAIVRYLRDLSVLQVAPDRLELVDASDEERRELAAEAKRLQDLDRSRVTQMFERMLRCCDELGKTLQPRLVLDCALIDVATVEPLVPLGDLIERLGELEARISRGQPARPAAAKRAPAAMASMSPAGPSGARPEWSEYLERATPPVRRPSPAFASGTVPGRRTPEDTKPSVPPLKQPPSKHPVPPAAAKKPGKPEFRRRSTSGCRRGRAGCDARGAPVPMSEPPSAPIPATWSERAGTESAGRGWVRAAEAVGSLESLDDVLRAWNTVLGELESRRSSRCSARTSTRSVLQVDAGRDRARLRAGAHDDIARASSERTARSAR